jgi:hypothetical protein
VSSDESPPDPTDLLDTLSVEVKSRILDRIVQDLVEGRPLGLGPSGYTKSDSGVYGKYQKQDVSLEQVLAAIEGQVEQIIADYERIDEAERDE